MADEHGYQSAFEAALWRLQEQLDRSRTLDNRLGGAFALSAAMIALLGGALLFSGPSEAPGIQLVVYAASGLFILNIVLSTVALLIGRLTLAPDLDALPVVLREFDEPETLGWLIEGLRLAVEANGGSLRRKHLLVNLAVAATTATAIAIVAAALLQASL